MLFTMQNVYFIAEILNFPETIELKLMLLLSIIVFNETVPLPNHS